MKTLKLTLAVAFLAASALVSGNAAEAVLSPRAAANAPRVVASSSGATTVATRTTVGSPRGLATFPGSGSSNASTDAMAHCKTAKKGQCHMPCCG